MIDLSDFFAGSAFLLSVWTFWWTTFRQGKVACSPVPHLDLVRGGNGFWAICTRFSLIATGARSKVIRRLYASLEYKNSSSLKIAFPFCADLSRKQLGDILVNGDIPQDPELRVEPFLTISPSHPRTLDACFYFWQPNTVLELGEASFVVYAETMTAQASGKFRETQLFSVDMEIKALPEENSYLGCSNSEMSGRFVLDSPYSLQITHMSRKKSSK